MISIKGEGLFVGEGELGNGMRMAKDLESTGFKVTPVFVEKNEPKIYRFVFECESGNLVKGGGHGVV